MKPERILTKNPDPTKKGVKVNKDRYDYMRGVILGIIKTQGPLSNTQLIEAVVDEVERNGKVDYSVGWCAMAVKLDLEARGEILYDRSAKKPVLSLP
jgi:hypothetical protein